MNHLRDWDKINCLNWHKNTQANIQKYTQAERQKIHQHVELKKEQKSHTATGAFNFISLICAA